MQESPVDQVCSQELESISNRALRESSHYPKCRVWHSPLAVQGHQRRPNRCKRETRGDETIDAAIRNEDVRAGGCVCIDRALPLWQIYKSSA